MYKPPLPALFTAARSLLKQHEASAEASTRMQPVLARTLSTKAGEVDLPSNARGKHKPDGKARLTPGPRARAHGTFEAMSRCTAARETPFDAHAFMAKHAQPSDEALLVQRQAHESLHSLEAQINNIRAQAVAQAEERAKVHDTAAAPPEEQAPAELVADAPLASIAQELEAMTPARGESVPDLHETLAELEVLYPALRGRTGAICTEEFARAHGALVFNRSRP